MTKPPEVRVLDNNLELAWAAGLFAGEGCASLLRQQHRSYVYPALSLVMMDKRSVERFCQALAPYAGPRRKGPISGLEVRSGKSSHNKTVWQVRVAGESARNLFAVLLPLLEGTDKGDQIARVLREADALKGPAIKSTMKLSRAEVAELRRLYSEGNTTQAQIANKFGISKSQAGKILRREQWAHD